MLVHTVYFWLRNELSQTEKDRFKAGLNTLKGISQSKATYIGTPSTTDRPVIDTSYDYGLTVIFENMADHDDYQVDPIHKAFLDCHMDKWKKVVIYDAD